VLILCPSAFV
jgi:hypothetical protein